MSRYKCKQLLFLSIIPLLLFFVGFSLLIVSNSRGDYSDDISHTATICNYSIHNDQPESYTGKLYIEFNHNNNTYVCKSLASQCHPQDNITKLMDCLKVTYPINSTINVYTDSENYGNCKLFPIIKKCTNSMYMIAVIFMMFGLGWGFGLVAVGLYDQNVQTVRRLHGYSEINGA